MKITRAALYRFRLPLTAPLQLGRAQVGVREGWLIRLEDEQGRAGWGEAAPLPGFSRESFTQVQAALHDLLPRLEGARCSATAPLPDGFDAHLAAAPPSVRFGMEAALADLLAQERGETLADLFDAQCRGRDASPGRPRTVALCALLAGTEEAIFRACARIGAEGHRVVKLKVGRQAVAADLVLVAQVRARLPPGVALRLDANRAWSLEQAREFFRHVDPAALEYVEEPLAQPAQLAQLAQTGAPPLALDETLVDTPVERWEGLENLRALVLKPTLLGGITPALRLARWALARGVAPVVSAAFESGVGLRVLAQLAAAVGPDVAAGLDTARWLREDVVVPRPAFDRARVGLAALDAPGRQIQHVSLVEEPLRHD